MGAGSDTSPVAPPDPWDPVVRVTHWAIGGIVLVNAVTTEGGSAWHVTLGWIGMAFLALRLAWGVFGTPEARFSAFPPDPRAAIGHLGALATGRVDEHPSHNPAGALMAYALWAALAACIGTGLWMTSAATPMQIAADRAAVAAGDWSALVKEQDDDAGAASTKAPKWVEELHDVAGNLMLVLAVLHVAGVAVESRALRRNLVRPMLLGNRNTHTR